MLPRAWSAIQIFWAESTSTPTSVPVRVVLPVEPVHQTQWATEYDQMESDCIVKYHLDEIYRHVTSSPEMVRANERPTAMVE